MKIEKKYIALGVLALIFYYPIRHYATIWYFQAKFASSIDLQCDSVFLSPKPRIEFTPEEYTEVTRLYYLCKSWGFLKYYHENHITIRPEIDSILLDVINKVIVPSCDQIKYGQIIESMIDSIQITPLSGQNPYPDIAEYSLIDNKWMDDTLCLNPSIKERFSSIFSKHTGKRNPFIFNKSSLGNIRMVNESEYREPHFPKLDVRLLGLFRFWNLINYFNVHKQFMDVDWDEELYHAIPRFMTANTEKQYRLEIYRLMNFLKDTHASFPMTVDNAVQGMYRPNFRMTCINDTFIVSSIRTSDYTNSDIQVGDIILRVDGKDIHSIRDTLRSYTGGGNYWSEQRFLCNAILSRFDSITQFTIRRGTEIIERSSTNYQAYALHQNERKNEINKEKHLLYRWIDDSVAYIDLASATDKNFNQNYQAVKTAKTIILDLRCYPSADLILPLTNAFVPPNSYFALSTYPDCRFPGLVRWKKTTSDNIGKASYYKGNIVVLVNENTESYSEYMTMALQANPKTKTIGCSSSGADGNFTLFQFPGNVKVIYTGMGIYYPDFTPTFRRGVKIDYVVEPSITTIQNKKDIIYEKAIHYATGSHR